eukprot:GDKI01024233.1.p1 GENE.GDKI01024233.1~~GDKI01024233.1.p1  ORF type:complete len:626 (-),score=132.13 GDKI01024233.1:47-1888(-)
MSAAIEMTAESSPRINLEDVSLEERVDIVCESPIVSPNAHRRSNRSPRAGLQSPITTLSPSSAAASERPLRGDRRHNSAANTANVQQKNKYFWVIVIAIFGLVLTALCLALGLALSDIGTTSSNTADAQSKTALEPTTPANDSNNGGSDSTVTEAPAVTQPGGSDTPVTDDSTTPLPATTETPTTTDTRPPCGGEWSDCSLSHCCSEPGVKCFSRDTTYARCMRECPWDWNCDRLDSAEDPVTEDWMTPESNFADQGLLLGASLDWSHDTPTAFVQRLGRNARMFNAFVITQQAGGDAMRAALDDADKYATLCAEEDRRQRDSGGGGVWLMLTFEAFQNDPLETVNDEILTQLGDKLAYWNDPNGPFGIQIVLRFMHEMNGGWYPWGQNPAKYTALWRKAYTIVRAKTRRTHFLWAPNSGKGYPFPQQPYFPTDGSAALDQLDTNRNGQPDSGDDPFAPYWPGDRYVDAVGMSLYWYGKAFPYGKNELVESNNYMIDMLAYAFFYGKYAKSKGKAIIIAETAAAYYQPGDGESVSPEDPSETALKDSWFAQLYNRNTLRNLPLIRAICWFEIAKRETFGAGTPYLNIDFRSTYNQDVKNALVSRLGQIGDLLA